MPAYRMVVEDPRWDARKVGVFESAGVPIELWRAQTQGLDLWLVGGIEAFDLVEDSRSVYSPDRDAYLRFSRAVLDLPSATDWRPDVVHAHDWHTGFIPVLIREAGGIEAALAKGALPKLIDTTLSEGLVLGLLKQGVKKYLAIFGHGSTDLGEVLRIYEEAGVTRTFNCRNEVAMAHAATALRWQYGETPAVVTSIGPGAMQAFAGSLAAASNGVGVYHIYGDETTFGEGYNMQQVPKEEQGLFGRMTALMGGSYVLHTPEGRRVAGEFFPHLLKDFPAVRRFRRRADETWTIHMVAIQARGSWSGVNPFEPAAPCCEGPLVVLTRATIRWRRLAAFWSRVPATNRSLDGVPGLVLSIGIGEAPAEAAAVFALRLPDDGVLRDGRGADDLGPRGDAELALARQVVAIEVVH